MGPAWVLSAPGGPHIGPIYLAIRVAITPLLLPELNVVSKCVESSDGAVSVDVTCEDEEITRIDKINVWRTNSDTDCENIDSEDLSQYSCESLVRDLVRTCNLMGICTFNLEYPNRDYCSEQDYLPNRPILLEIMFECRSRKYFILKIISIYRTVRWRRYLILCSVVV